MERIVYTRKKIESRRKSAVKKWKLVGTKYSSLKFGDCFVTLDRTGYVIWQRDVKDTRIGNAAGAHQALTGLRNLTKYNKLTND